jgi:uncharacterized protein YbgA (DUF1722 family)/uncharacterized protein YbbK (DUF523 family)
MGLPVEPAAKVRLGASACLLGRAVRFNGGHCADGFLLRDAARFAEFVPVCPEVEIGLGTPRETLRLQRNGDLVVLRAPKSGRDWTADMREYARHRVAELRGLDLDGYVLKKDSPSCGMQRVKVYDQNGAPSKEGVGLFAEELMRAMPLLPVEEEGRLNDRRLRENFFERAFAYRRLKDLFAGAWKPADLVRFHTAEKLLLLSHDPASFKRLGRLVAEAGRRDCAELAHEYMAEFMAALAKPASPKRQRVVLERILGHFRPEIDAEAKRDLLEAIEDFRSGLTPLATPMALARHYARRFRSTYIQKQTYLQPHPKELALRSHV